jgi:hypothetical protein
LYLSRCKQTVRRYRPQLRSELPSYIFPIDRDSSDPPSLEYVIIVCRTTTKGSYKELTDSLARHRLIEAVGRAEMYCRWQLFLSDILEVGVLTETVFKKEPDGWLLYPEKGHKVTAEGESIFVVVDCTRLRSKWIPVDTNELADQVDITGTMR